MDYPRAQFYQRIIDGGYPMPPIIEPNSIEFMFRESLFTNKWLEMCNRLCMRLCRMPSAEEAIKEFLARNKDVKVDISTIDFTKYQFNAVKTFLTIYWKQHNYEITDDEVSRRMEAYYKEHPYERPEGG